MTNTYQFLNGGGRMGSLIRAVDWSPTILGAPESWPQSLKSALSITLNSAFPIAIYWGRSLTLLYNDAWSSIPGDKHPWCLGRPGAEVWPEIWEGLKDEFESVLQNGESVRRDDALLLMRRHGYTEECYFNYTLSPIIDEDGAVRGVFNAVVETSYKVINERRNSLLLKLLQQLYHVNSVEEGMSTIKDVLEEAWKDICFCVFYTTSHSNEHRSRLAFSLRGTPEMQLSSYPFANWSDDGQSRHLSDLSAYFSTPVMSVWGEPCTEAFIAPVAGADAPVRGFMVFGVSPRKTLDFEYRQYLETVAVHSGTILNNCYSIEQRKELTRERLLNEELAAANEELTAINEELQLTQDALRKLNSELEDRVARRTRALTESEKQIRHMLNAIPQQVWTAKPDGSMDYVNDVVISDFGIGAEHILAWGWQKFIHPEDLQHSMVLWQKALESGEEYVTEFRLLIHGRGYVWHLSRAVSLVEDGMIKMWIGTSTDIEFQKNNEQKKDEFLSIASHELKTPLTSIRAFNQLMKRTSDPLRLKDFTEKSALHIFRLEKLISDLLDVTKINAGKMIYSMEHFSFRQMIVNSIESVQQMSPTHQIVLEESADIDFVGDALRLEQVVQNFLTNAVKYSPGGQRVLVNCKLEMGNVVVAVRDFGIGIDRKHLDRLFDRYYRVDNTAMRFEGLGLGLFISSEILKRHNGSFWIESTPGEGSTFYFTLPFESRETSTPELDSGSAYSDNKITVVYNEALQRLEACWKGYQDLQSVQHGCMVMLRMLKNKKCYKVLNDNSQVLGTWSEAADWGREEWFPMMDEAGLKYFAWILSPSSFSQMSAQKSIDYADGNVVFQFFSERTAAEAWIDTK